eukprot:TRINITY_DN6247_c0_g2_i1.p1 TRINITY_DN6247_c0_g2~~TRINITY_DN6247_c0_g2_i1.p1  ORF type:complete len:672 (-),score=187.96 TRINITY_DN6247_c0_g2_i1:95-2110(-)
MRWLKTASVCLLLSAVVAVQNDLETDVSPTQKVLQLLDKMKKQGLEDKKVDAEEFASSQEFCDSTLRTKERSINEQSEKIDMLNAVIEENTASASNLKAEIEEHDSNLEKVTKDLEERKNVREAEEEDFASTTKDYSESMAAIHEAVKVLKTQAYSREEAASLLELATKSDPKATTTALMDFLRGQRQTSGQPAAKGYEFQSNHIVEMLQGLESKFLQEKNDLKLEEQKKGNSFELVKTSLNNQIEHAKRQSSKKAEFQQKALQALADAKAKLESVTADKAADTKYSKDLSVECKQKAADFKQRETLRDAELAAVAKVTEILSSASVTQVSEKHMPGLLQVRAGHALAQLRAKPSSAAAARKLQAVVKLLQKKAGALGSNTLSLMASQVSDLSPDNHADETMDKIKEMLQNLLNKLQTQATEETSHKAWCDTELAGNKLTRASKTDQRDSLAAELDQLETSIAKLTNENAETSAEITKMVESLSKATALRQQEKARNKVVIKEAEGAKAEVGKALVVLQDFYSNTALLQKSHKKAVDSKSSEYKGMQGEAGSVVSLLEVIMADFSRLVSETEADDRAGDAQYQKFSEDTKVDKAEKETTAKHNEQRIQEQKSMLEQRKNDFSSTQAELKAADKYYEELHLQCLDSNKAAEDQRLKRQEEIEALEEAKAALS